MLHRKTTTSGVLAIMLIVLATTTASGQSSWNNSFGGSFGLAGNWTPAVVPTGGVIFGLSSPGYVVTMDTSRWTFYLEINNDTVTIDLKGYTYQLFNSGLFVGYFGGNKGVLTLQNGGFECQLAQLACSVGLRGAVQVVGGTWWKNNDTMTVGLAGTGQLTVSGGGTVTGTPSATLGQNAGPARSSSTA